MWQAFVNLIASGLVFFNDMLVSVGIPFSFGFAIILFTVVIKALTFPLNQQQMKSTKAQQELQPKLKALQKKYANDKEKLAQEQMKMYKEAGVNPLGGCLPMLVQMPVWFALYQALYNLAGDNPALQEGFFWIPSLAGPVTSRTDGIGWLTNMIDGAPAMGWPSAIGYMVLPVLLVVSQLYMQRMMTPASNDPQQKAMGQAMMFMPFMFGYFALVVPSGLSLYWFTNNILSMAQQYYVNKMKVRDAEQIAAQPEQIEETPEAQPEKPKREPAKPKSKQQPKSKSNGRSANGSLETDDTEDEDEFLNLTSSPRTIIIEGSADTVDTQGQVNDKPNETPIRAKSKRKRRK